MPTSSTLSYPNTLTNATTADATQVMADFNAVATLLNTTGLGTNNIKTGTVTAALLASDVIDGTTMDLNGSNQVRVKDAGISAAKLAIRATGTSVTAAGGVGISLGCGNFIFTNSSTDVTNLSVSFVSRGNPVVIKLVPVAGAAASISCTGTASGSGGTTQYLTFLRGATDIGSTLFRPDLIRGPALEYFDTPAAGTYTYKAQTSSILGSGTCSTTLNNYSLVVYELQ